MLHVAREGDAYAAVFLSGVSIFPCAGARDEEANRRLREAFMRGDFAGVRSLRRDAHGQEESCWLHGEGFCLSKLAAAAGSD
jgi:protein-L-isoaspartate(D-aspartate) O-methyltransferase